MKLRKLELKDAQLMLECMQDEEVVKKFGMDFNGINVEGCENFIKESQNGIQDIHYAIVDGKDEYMGMVSLKHINRTNSSAELAIVVRKIAMGKGYSLFGMKEVAKKAFDEYNLESIYWCVPMNNERAIHFYKKYNFHEVFDIPRSIHKGDENIDGLKWYSILKGDVLEDRIDIVGCKIVHIRTVPTVGAGELSFFEATHDISFEIKRMYYISKVPEDARRGGHAHKQLKQLLFCPYGRIQVILENRNGRAEIELSDPAIGVVIEEPTWREMIWLQKDSVLCVAASDFYDENDYIRNYEDFKAYIR